jgi:hypothetical protein
MAPQTRTRIVLISISAIAAVLVVSACGSSHTGSSAPTSQTSQSPQSVLAAQSPVTAPGYATPEDAVAGLVQGELADNSSELCSFLPPSSQSACNADAQQQPLPAFTGNPTVAGGEISGSEALVSLTGSICEDGGGCTGNSDPAAGMPNYDVPFAQAYEQALSNPGGFSPVACIEENGMWYVNANV